MSEQTGGTTPTVDIQGRIATITLRTQIDQVNDGPFDMRRRAWSTRREFSRPASKILVW